MKNIIYLTFLLSSFGALGQHNDQTSRWQIGINLSPDISYKKAELTGYGSYYLSLMDQPMFGYTGSVNVACILQKHYSLEAGVQYSSRGYKSKERTPYNPFIHAVNTPRYATLSNRYAYIGIPVRLIYRTDGEKIRFITSAGANTEFLISATTNYRYEYQNGSIQEGSNNSLEGYNRITVTPFVSAGVEMNLSPEFNFRIEPIFRYSVLQMENSSNLTSKTFLWNAGINLAFYYNI